MDVYNIRSCRLKNGRKSSVSLIQTIYNRKRPQGCIVWCKFCGCFASMFFFDDWVFFQWVIGPDADFGQRWVWHHGFAHSAMFVWVEDTAEVDAAQVFGFVTCDVFVERLERGLSAVHEVEEGLDQR